MSSKKLPPLLNICLISYHFPILGRSTDHGFLWPIAKGLASYGHSVTVLAAKSPLGKEEVVRDNVRVFYLHEGFPNLSNLRFETAVFQKFSDLHRQQPFDLLHSIDGSGFKIGLHRKEFGIAVGYDVEATQMAQLFSILGMGQEKLASLLQTGFAVTYKFLTTYFSRDRKLLQTADGIFVTSPQQGIFLERYYLYPEFKTYTVPYGIEIRDLTERLNTDDLKKKLKLPENAQLTMTITDMSETLEVKNLVTAFERVAVKKPNCYMIIIGNGSAFKEIEYHILSLALGSRVILAGALSPEEISVCLSISEVYVNMSSRSTGFEPSMLEAMTRKKIIIGSEVSPIAHIVEDGVDGFLLRPADIESLSHLLVEIFSGTMPTADIGARASEKLTNIFDTKKMVAAVEQAYKKILTNSKSYSPAHQPKGKDASSQGVDITK
jgi:glycosyltransferase involved in cell wall biosynthesis